MGFVPTKWTFYPRNCTMRFLCNLSYGCTVAESTSLRERLHTDLTDNLPVTVTAIGMALAAFALVSLDSIPLALSTDFSARFLLSLSLLDMAFAYDDYWPVAYSPMYAVTWTLVFGVLTAGLFISIYEVALPNLGNTVASVAAFVTVVSIQFGSAMLYAHIR